MVARTAVRPLAVIASLAALLALSPGRAAAQSAAVLAGTARSQDGTPLAARVAFAPDGGTVAAATTADASGRFRLEIPAGTPGVLQLAALGHSPAEVRIPALAAGATRRVAATLATLHVLDAVTVVARRERPLLNTENAATGGALEAEELEALPTDAREPLSLAFTIPGVAQATGFFGDAPPLSIAGGNALYTQYTLDGLDNNEGFLGGPRVELPLGALARLEVLASTYSSSFGRSSNGVVNAESRAGGTRWRGDAFGYLRPGTPFDADPKVAPAGVDPDGFQRFQVGASASGAPLRDRLFVALAAEYTNEDEDRIGSTAQTAFIGTEQREKVKLFGRADWGWSPTQTTTLRFAASHVNRAGRGSGVVVPEADITTRRIGTLAALTHRSALGGGAASNIVSLQFGTYRWYFPPTRSDFTRPQVQILDPTDSTVQAIVGSSNFVFDETERQLQLRNVFETALGERHRLRAGADVVRSWFYLDGANTNPSGAYRVFNDGNIVRSDDFLSIEDVPDDVRVLDYTIDARPQQVDLAQTLVGAFVEDVWRVTPSLTLTAGLRWDYDDITSRGESDPDLNNVQPRVAFNWYRTARSVVRGGAGIYTGRFPYAVFSDAVQFGPGGNAPVTLTEFQGESIRFLDGPAIGELQALADTLPREVRRTFALGLEQPFSRQLSLGYQFQLGDDWGFSIDGVLVQTRNLPRSVDLNPIGRALEAGDTLNLACDGAASCPGDPLRPDDPAESGYRRLTTTESGGRADYKALFVAARRRMSDDWTLEAGWVWSHAQNDTEDINFTAAQANCFGEEMRDAVTGARCASSEWADAIDDRRHKVTLRSVVTVADRLRLSLVADWQTGQPVNRVAGVVSPDGGEAIWDLDGSGPIYGPGFVGNHDRFPGVPRNGERLPNFFELSAGAASVVGLGGRSLELRADVFNALNATEWGGFATGIPGGGSRTQIGRPGDPIRLRAAGRPRQVQFSARYVF
jgi:outer membrane receptor protein involved in Fe transport